MLARMRARQDIMPLIAMALLTTFPSAARVARVEIASRTDVLGDREFGSSGSYERLTGRIYFSVAIGNPHNQRVVDLANAVNVKDGEVEFSADFVALHPKDAHLGNGSLLLENPNRGQAVLLALVDGGDRDLAKDAGDAWLLRNGYTIVSLGWQWDATGPGALRLYAPTARDHGRTITGLLRGDYMPARMMPEIPLGHLIVGRIGGLEYSVADPKDPRNRLTVRDSRDAPRVVIPRTEWQFARTRDGRLVPSDRDLHLTGGFQAGKIYEYVYVVADPVVAGCGFAAMRDFAAYAKHDPRAITPAERVYGEGISQNGRFLRDFLYQGFNADEEGRIALDGVLAHVAGAGRGSFNYRFAQPSRDAQPTSSVFFPTDIFPFTDESEQDPITGSTAGLLDRARAENVVPKIFFSNTSYEYWGRAGALIHVSADGSKDAPISDNVRIYHFTGLQHYSGPFPAVKGTGDMLGRQPQSPLPVKYFWRAMIANMDSWVRSNLPPPASRYPKISDGTLVRFEDWRFPAIPGVKLPHEANAAYHLDFGPAWQDGILSLEPPKVGPPFPVLVPQVDGDGNEEDGIRLPEVAVPLATYTGWNLRDPSIGAPEERIPFEGSYLPFSRTAAERDQRQDPRKSIAERYRSEADYMARFTRALDDLILERWILPEDRSPFVERGKREWVETNK
jgi:hypothetical protein